MAKTATKVKSAKAKVAEAAALTVGRLRELLSYDPETGEFRRLVVLSNSSKIGQTVGVALRGRYAKICVDGVRYYAHRLAWLHIHGCWPKEQVDHINGDRSDNRLANLRECTNAENSQNAGTRVNNTSGLMGIHWCNTRRRWVAQIRQNGKIRGLGRFSSREEAQAAYISARAQTHAFQPIPRGWK